MARSAQDERGMEHDQPPPAAHPPLPFVRPLRIPSPMPAAARAADAAEVEARRLYAEARRRHRAMADKYDRRGDAIDRWMLRCLGAAAFFFASTIPALFVRHGEAHALLGAAGAACALGVFVFGFAGHLNDLRWDRAERESLARLGEMRGRITDAKHATREA